MLFLDFRELAIISECDVQRIKAEVDSHVSLRSSGPRHRQLQRLHYWLRCAGELRSDGRLLGRELRSWFDPVWHSALQLTS